MFDYLVVGAGFAGAVIAEQGKDPATRSGQRDAVDRSGVAIAHHHVPHLNGAHLNGVSPTHPARHIPIGKFR